MPEKLSGIRHLIAENNLDAYILFHDDEFFNEYLPPHNERLAFLTNFTGSAGYAVITQDKAALFVPGLYTLQVRLETSAEFFSYHDFKKDGLSNWLISHLKPGQKVGLDARIINKLTVDNLEKKLKENDILLSLIEGKPLVDQLWDNDNRPVPIITPITLYDETMAGRSVSEKQEIVLKTLKEEKADAVIMNELDAIAWFLNIRGNDVPYNPLVLSYLIVHKSGDIDFFADTSKITSDVQQHFDTYHITCHEIDHFYDFLSRFDNQTVLINTASMPAAIANLLKGEATVQHGKNPCTLPKAIKTGEEQQSMRQAHLIDGIALTKFLHWLSTEGQSGHVDELGAIAKLSSFRQQSDLYLGPSFDTIAGSGSNGAIIHYRANQKTNAVLEKDSLFLCDSGGQYKGGTTDVTRTVAIGSPTQDMVRNFTLVLKGHINIALQHIKPGTTGEDIDPIARASLKEQGLDYNHGTGHGVGVQLCVHEGPAAISPRNTIPLEVGMILSNEPGYYQEGEYGIRIESLILIQKDTKGDLFFETLTLAPIDHNLIDDSLLNEEEKEWLNTYHQRVYETISPHLDTEQGAWLKKVTAPR